MDRPRVVVLNGASVDGRLAVSPEVLLLYGDERWQALGGESQFDVFNWLKARHKVGATLEGSGSFVRDDQQPDPLPPFEGDRETLYRDFLPPDRVSSPALRGWFTVVDGRGRVRWGHKDGAAFGEEWAGWYLLALVGRHTPPEYLAYLRREGTPYLVAGEGRVDLEQALVKMRSLLGVECVLSTGGGRLNGALLRAGVIDEVNVEFLPALIGGVDTPSLYDSPALGPDEQPTHLKLISCHAQDGGRVWLRYEVVR
jgi:2,5-diamino-6-(ribosylamino)-4(3H)-pyrimidinone 5'-phosphate reductase